MKTQRKNPAAVSLGRRGGKATSDAKTAANRINARSPRPTRWKLPEMTKEDPKEVLFSDALKRRSPANYGRAFRSKTGTYTITNQGTDGGGYHLALFTPDGATRHLGSHATFAAAWETLKLWEDRNDRPAVVAGKELVA